MKKYVIGIVILCVAVLGFFFYPKTERMSIVFACSDSYVPHVGTAMTSILMNADKDDKFDFYILQDDISEENKQKFEDLKRIKDFNIKFISVNPDRFKDLKIKHLSRHTYYRYIIPEIIRGKKALYLDADVIIKKSLKKLYNTDISNFFAAAVQDIDSVSHISRLSLKNYVNAGVLLLNLEKMRKDNITEKLFKITTTFQTEPWFHQRDQDGLNVVFNDNILLLPLEYNDFTEINNQKTVIFHFIHLWKPVTKVSEASKVYWHYRQLSPWAKEKQPIIVLRDEMKYLWAKKLPTLK